MKKGAKKAGKKPAKNSKDKNEQIKSDIFNFDNEIVIGVTKLPDKPSNKKNKKDSKNKQENKKAENKKSKKVASKSKKDEVAKNKTTNKNKKAKPNKKIDLKKEKRKRRIIAFLKGMAIVTIIVGIFLAIMLSPLFKLEEIEIKGISKISSQEAIILSEIEKGNNIFLINNNSAINKLKQNPYIENVKIKKQLPDKIIIEIKERQATFALKYLEKYIYINNQGYILETAESTNNLPQILSYRTSADKIEIGGRLEQEDLELLGTILKIMESANNNGIGNLITSIDIANKNDIILKLESER